jgi:hypothetical protein
MPSQADQQNLIIYHTADGQAAVSLYARDGNVWMNQAQLAELFTTSVPNISIDISNILKEKELDRHSVIKDYLTTAADGKDWFKPSRGPIASSTTRNRRETSSASAI